MVKPPAAEDTVTDQFVVPGELGLVSQPADYLEDKRAKEEVKQSRSDQQPQQQDRDGNRVVERVRNPALSIYPIGKLFSEKRSLVVNFTDSGFPRPC